MTPEERRPGDEPEDEPPFLERVPFSDDSLIIAPARWNRPLEFRTGYESPAESAACPFCCGRETETPPALAEYATMETLATGELGNAPSSPDRSSPDVEHPWQVRVVPNKYPVTAAPGRAMHATATAGRQPVEGTHEVVVESPDHVLEWTDLPADQRRLVVCVWRDRLAHAARSRSFGSLFKNNGPRAGASLGHVHSQLIAVDFIPPAVQRMERELESFHQAQGDCWLCRHTSRRSGPLAITETTEHFHVAVPAFARMAGETWIVPRRHACHFHESSDGMCGELADTLAHTISRLRREIGHFDYNVVVQTPSFRVPLEEPFHWHVRIIPRIVVLGGFEWATACFINPLDPHWLARSMAPQSE